MELISKLIDNLDTVAAARSYVNVFQLRKGMDATLTANLIAQMFTGQGRQANQNIGQQGLNQQGVRPILTLSGDPAAGASLIDLRLSVDDRTNSLIVAGSRNDLDVISAVIARLEGVDSSNRFNEVIKLRNAAAGDVQNALQGFFNNVLTSYTQAGYSSPYQLLQRQVYITAEPVSNTILVSATPDLFAEIRKIIDKIDSQPPQVMIQVTIAEVQLTNAEEAGVEVALQAPVLFRRGNTGGTIGVPGFNFNTPGPQTLLPSASLGNAETVGFQGLGTLGVGRTSTTGQGFGGFVFSASSDTFSLLVRALKAQGRVDVLSRPQLQVADNQTGYMNVGQQFPFPTTSTITTGLAQQGIDYRDIGVSLRVTPRVNPDGKVLLRVEPNVSSVQPGAVSVGGIQAFVFNQQTVQTTVLASDGETIVLGGLISKQETRQENGIPYVKDIPYVGALFRYRTHTVQRREIIIIMTPHIIRSEYDQARILAEEAGPTKHCWPDILAAHKHGGEVIEPALKGARPVPTPPAMPGPAYFGTFDQAPFSAPSALPPGGMQPGPMPPTAAAPGSLPPFVAPGAMPPGAGAVPLAPIAPGAPSATPGLPGAAAHPPVGLIPTSGAQPTFTAPTFAQPGGTQPTAVPMPMPAAPVAAQPGFVMGQPGTNPTAPVMAYPVAQPLPGMPVVPGAPNRGFTMSGRDKQPVSGKDAPPADAKPTTAKEGIKSWVFGR